MGKRKAKQKGEYNDHLDGERLADNTGIRTSLQEPPKSLAREVPPPPGLGDGGVSISVTGSASTSAAGPETTSQVLEAKSTASTANKPPKKPPLTHFLCIPLVGPETRPRLQEALEKLALDVEEKDLISNKAVRPVGTLHLTLAVMSLDAEGLERAGRVLQELDLRSLIPATEGSDISHSSVQETGQEKVAIPTSSGATEDAPTMTTASDPTPNTPIPPTTTTIIPTQGHPALISLDLKSLVPMQTPAKTSVLYAQPHDPTARLYPFTSALRSAFSAKDLIVEETRPLKLHATVFNTIYAKGGRGSGKGRGGKDGKGGRGKDKSWMKVDARELVEEWKDFVWAEGVEVDRVCICKMGAKKVWSGGSEGKGDVVDEVYEVVFERKI